MDDKEKVINKINASASLYKSQYLEQLKKEYNKLLKDYEEKDRIWRSIFIINIVKRKQVHSEMKQIKVKMGDLNQRIKMIEDMD